MISVTGTPGKATRMSHDEAVPVMVSSALVDNAPRRPLAGMLSTAGFSGGRLPPIGVLLARPLLLVLCAMLGAIGGYLFTAGVKDSAATATIVFAVLPNSNRDEVALEGATLQRTIAPGWVLQNAATSLGEQQGDLEPRTKVTWQEGTRLLNITSTAETGDGAVKRANAVAAAAVAASDSARNQRLDAAVQESNLLLSELPLADPDAEVARRNQIGTSLGERQNEIQADSMSLIVISPAVKAKPVGLSKAKGTVVGLASGLLAGAILAVLVGTRGMRVPAPGGMQRLAPDVKVLASSELSQIAGQLVEAGETLVVVIATRGASGSAVAVSKDLERLLTAHRKSVRMARPDLAEDLASIGQIGADASRAVPSRHTSVGSQVDPDVVLLNVVDSTEAASMLEGRAGFAAVIVVRRRKTPIASALAACRSFARARSLLVVVAEKSPKR